MPLHLPDGKRLAVAVTPDVDAHSLWMGTFNLTTPGYLSRGEFGAEVGVPRVLGALKSFGITTTWCIPTHTIATFPDQVTAVAAAGHEIAAHGVYHEPVTKLEPSEERRLLELQIAQHENLLGRRPAGYRSPAWDFSEVTLDLLEEFEFTWDSSLMGRDFEIYRPRRVDRLDREQGNVFGKPSPVLEVPVSWYLDDFPVLDSVPRGGGLGSTATVLERWKDSFDFAYGRVPGGVFTLTVHPETIGRGHALLMFEEFLAHAASHDGVWFAPISDIVACWQDADAR